jgi:hypothetical protein
MDSKISRNGVRPNMDFLNYLGEILGFNAKIREKQVLIDYLNTNISELNGKVNQLTATLDSTSIADKKLIAELQAKIGPGPKETYWNTRYPKINQNYMKWENKLSYQVDVRDFFNEQDSNLPIISGSTNDEKALNSLLWIMNNVTYVADKTVYGYDEYWAWAFETLARKKGDCEDGAILLANIMLRAEIPYWRIRLNAGSVNGGGHCYVTYCRETDDQFVVLDWCYWTNKKPVSERLLHKEEMNYDDPLKNYGIWFSWNKLYAFGEMQTMTGKPDYFQVN